MKINEVILTERVVNLFNPDEKQKYAKPVWDMLQTAYEPSGGFGSAASIEELIDKTALWKLVVRDGNISALAIYKDSQGRKGIASASDGSFQGKKDYRMIRQDDIKLKRSWAEVSGGPEAIIKKLKGEPLPNKFAPILTGKKILNYNDDGIHYTRLIAGVPREKVIYGFVQLSPEMEQKIEAAGIDLQDLPPNIQKSS